MILKNIIMKGFDIMKYLLNDAVEEMIKRINNEMNLVREEVRIVEYKGEKLNILMYRRDIITSLFDRLNYLKDQIEVRFPEEVEAINYIERFEYITNIQLEDLLNIIYEAGYEILEDEEA